MSAHKKKGLFYLLFALLFFSTTSPYVYANIGIDPSWIASLVMAINNNFVFGKDFVFNYGPLGYLNTSMLPRGISPWLLVFFHIFILSNYLFIIKISFDKLKSKWWLGAIVSIIIFLPWGFFADISFTLFYLLIFWLLYVQKSRNALPLLLVLFLAVLIFYIKVNLSLFAFALFILSIIYFVLEKIITWQKATFLLALFSIFIIGLSFILHVSIPDYLNASIKIIDAYQDGQAVNIIRTKELFILLSFEGLIAGIVLFYIFKNRSAFRENYYLYILIAIAWFLCFKQAHTATGHYNVFGFFLFMPVLALLIYLFESKFIGGGRLLVYVLLIQLLATQFIRISYTNFNLKEYVLFYFPDSVVREVKQSKKPEKLFLTLKEKNAVSYFQKVFDYSYHNNFEQKEVLKKRRLPEEVVRKIGNQSVDIIPWEISYVFINQLNYKPRPVIQSYQANSDWLAAQNEQKYRGKDSPDIVLANIKNYREQNPFWMDKGAYLALFKNYVLTDTVHMPDEKLFLFQKKKGPQMYSLEGFVHGEGAMDQEIEIPSNQLVYFKSEIEYSILGKISRLFYQPPYLRCTLTLEGGEKVSFRIPPPILKGGIFVSEKVNTENDFLRFYLKEGKGNKKVKALKLWSKMPWGFQETFDYGFEKVM